MGYFLSMTLRLSGQVMVAVMRKQGQAHADIGGWHFNFSKGTDTSPGITPDEARAQEARDFVFSDPRR
jgi:hypothetical protein